MADATKLRNKEVMNGASCCLDCLVITPSLHFMGNLETVLVAVRVYLRVSAQRLACEDAAEHH